MLKRLKSGKFKIGSKSDAQEARKRLDEIQSQSDKIMAESGLLDLNIEHGALQSSLNEYLVEQLAARESLETPDWVGTKVVGHTRKWNPDKLAKLAPKHVFLKLVDLVPNSDKIDAAVRAGTLDRDSIEAAFEETPKQPYIKWTKKTEDKTAAREKEAAKVAEHLR